MDEFNTLLAKCLKRLKKDAGAVKISQGYKGTGSRSHRRQIFVYFSDGERIDLWLEGTHIQTWGVITRSKIPRATVFYDGRAAEAVYNDLVPFLNERL